MPELPGFLQAAAQLKPGGGGVGMEAAAFGAAPRATTAGTAQAAPFATVRRDTPCDWLFSMMPPCELWVSAERSP